MLRYTLSHYNCPSVDIIITFEASIGQLGFRSKADQFCDPSRLIRESYRERDRERERERETENETHRESKSVDLIHRWHVSVGEIGKPCLFLQVRMCC